MKHLPRLFPVFVLLSSLSVTCNGYAFPVPDTVSDEIRPVIAAPPMPLWQRHPANMEEWKTMVETFEKTASAEVPDFLAKMNVTCEKAEMAGVPVFILTPPEVAAEDQSKVLLFFHGGGYVLNGGLSGTREAIFMAKASGFRIVCADYRMAPFHPYPAAIDDAIAVYRELLKEYKPESIGVFGTSTGGGMTLVLPLRARKDGLPLPGALAAGTPWSDLNKTGDSYFTNAGTDNVLSSYDGLLADAVRVYANGHDLKDPMLSPVYGDVAGFPPTILTSGTRDLFLSNTVRMHTKLRQAGVEADLIVLEGLSHAQYYFVEDAPETNFHFAELSKFFHGHLR
ncbi:MAG: alpha/beta hydrolase [Mailhella sp.]|nr:alpha/beta hydrolase [Mailhella sp.]